MKVHPTLILLAIACVQIDAASIPRCSNVPAGCRTGAISAAECCEKYSGTTCNLHLPHETNCNNFYQCEHNKPTLKVCSNPLHFNPTLEVCDWADDSGCVSKPGPGPEPTTPRPTTPSPIHPPVDECKVAICDNCRKGEFDPDICCSTIPYYYKIYWRNPKDCSSYYQCNSGKAERKSCPAGLHWSDAEDRCEWPNIAKCSNAPPTTTPPSTTTSSTTTPSTTTPSTTTPSTTTPSTTTPSTTTPVSTTSFSTTVRSTSLAPPTSTLPSGSECAVGVSEDCRHGRKSAAECCSGVPATIDVLLQNNEKCNTFYQCVHGKPMVRNCAESFLKWNADLCRCEWADNATC